MRNLLLYICTFLLAVSTFAENKISTGIKFLSHTEIKEKRTSLFLNPDKDFNIKDSLILSFDVMFRQELHNYGYVFRLILDDDISFDLVANFSKTGRSLSLIEKNRVFLSFPKESLSGYEENKWANVVFKLSPQNIEIQFDGKTLAKSSSFYSKFRKCKIYFGASDHSKFISDDVPPMTIRNISVSNESAKPLAHWALKEHAQNEVYDTIHRQKAIAKNAIWLIDMHTRWKKEKEFQLRSYTQAAYNEKDNCIYFVNKSDFYKYSLNDNRIDTIVIKNGNPYNERNNQLIYNPYYDELWSYDLDLNSLSIYNEQTLEWTQGDTQNKNPNFSQHNAFISPVDSALYIFGGYGNYEYKNSLQRKSRDSNSIWEKLNYKENIPPRYLAGLGFKDENTLLIFGGYGNTQGKQEYGPQNYYDLFQMDIRTFKVSKIWEIVPKNDDFVVGNSIIADSISNRLYALCFANNKTNVDIRLKSFDLDSGLEANYGDSIPFMFNDINSFCTLYYDRIDSKVYALTIENIENTATVKIYSLAFPPLMDSEIMQVKSSNYSLFIIVIGLSILVISLLFSRFRKIWSKQAKKEKESFPSIEGSPLVVQQRISSINFLGGFQVWDKQGQDITSQFTPILKKLLIAIILYSKKDDKGVSNVTLRDNLWSDMPEDNAQNNRRVNIHKLKSLLEELNEIELDRDSIYWTISIGENSFCDYLSVCDFTEQVKNGKGVCLDLPSFPVKLLSEPLLPFVEEVWLDPFKANYSNMVIEAMIVLSKQEYISSQNDFLREISHVMFSHDKIDEYALKLRCQALCRSGKTGMAKSAYDSFCSEYKSLLESDYPKSFKEVCQEKLV